MIIMTYVLSQMIGREILSLLSTFLNSPRSLSTDCVSVSVTYCGIGGVYAV